MWNSVSCRSYNCCRYRDKGKNPQNFIFHNNADEMKKKVCSKPLFFFSEKQDVTVNDVRDIGYVGRSNYIIAV